MNRHRQLLNLNRDVALRCLFLYIFSQESAVEIVLVCFCAAFGFKSPPHMLVCLSHGDRS